MIVIHRSLFWYAHIVLEEKGPESLVVVCDLRVPGVVVGERGLV